MLQINTVLVKAKTPAMKLHVGKKKNLFLNTTTVEASYFCEELSGVVRGNTNRVGDTSMKDIMPKLATCILPRQMPMQSRLTLLN